jgi:hypothetical protein
MKMKSVVWLHYITEHQISVAALADRHDIAEMIAMRMSAYITRQLH